VHLVGFIVRIYHGARSLERHILSHFSASEQQSYNRSRLLLCAREVFSPYLSNGFSILTSWPATMHHKYMKVTLWCVFLTDFNHNWNTPANFSKKKKFPQYNILNMSVQWQCSSTMRLEARRQRSKQLVIGLRMGLTRSSKHNLLPNFPVPQVYYF